MTKTDIKTKEVIVGFVRVAPLVTKCVECAPVEEYYELDQDQTNWLPMWNTDDFAQGSKCADCKKVIL